MEENNVYLKCPVCLSEDFFITEYQIQNNWVGKIRIDGKPNTEIKRQSDLTGYVSLEAVCRKCNHSIGAFNGGWRELLEKIKDVAKMQEDLLCQK